MQLAEKQGISTQRLLVMIPQLVHKKLFQLFLQFVVINAKQLEMLVHYATKLVIILTAVLAQLDSLLEKLLAKMSTNVKRDQATANMETA